MIRCRPLPARHRYVQRTYVAAGVLAAGLALLLYVAALGVIEPPHKEAIVPTILVLVLVNCRLRTGKWWPDLRRTIARD